MRRLRRTTKVSAVVFAVACVSIFVAPAANAQIGLPTTDTVTDTVTGTTDQVTDTVTGTVGDATDEASETVEETVNDPGSLPDRVTDTIEDVTEELPGGPATGPVKDVVNEVGNTIDDVTGGGSIVPGTDGGRDSFGNQPGRRRDRDRSVGSARASGSDVLGGTTTPRSDPLDGFAGALTLHSDGSNAVVELSTDPSFGERAAQIALETAKRLAFPMLLLGLVAMFLAFHGRVGRKDPKLALAVVDPEQNFLDFS